MRVSHRKEAPAGNQPSPKRRGSQAAASKPKKAQDSTSSSRTTRPSKRNEAHGFSAVSSAQAGLALSESMAVGTAPAAVEVTGGLLNGISQVRQAVEGLFDGHGQINKPPGALTASTEEGSSDTGESKNFYTEATGAGGYDAVPPDDENAALFRKAVSSKYLMDVPDKAIQETPGFINPSVWRTLFPFGINRLRFAAHSSLETKPGLHGMEITEIIKEGEEEKQVKKFVTDKEYSEYFTNPKENTGFVSAREAIYAGNDKWEPLPQNRGRHTVVDKNIKITKTAHDEGSFVSWALRNVPPRTVRLLTPADMKRFDSGKLTEYLSELAHETGDAWSLVSAPEWRAVEPTSSARARKWKASGRLSEFVGRKQPNLYYLARGYRYGVAVPHSIGSTLLGYGLPSTVVHGLLPPSSSTGHALEVHRQQRNSQQGPSILTVNHYDGTYDIFLYGRPPAGWDERIEIALKRLYAHMRQRMRGMALESRGPPI